MGDVSFFGGGGGAIGGSGVTNYNELTNRPVTNVTGNPVVLSNLSTGVYNIDGTWTAVPGADIYDSPADDLFYIYSDTNGVRATRISADGIYTITSATQSPSDVVYDSVATINDAVEQVKNNLWGEL